MSTHERRPMVAGNWKMHGTRALARELVEGIMSALESSPADVEILLCPPYVLIPQVVAQVAAAPCAIGVGAQDTDASDEGAFTGAVSAPMLADQGCSHVIVGHSERRHVYGESDETVAAKFEAVRRAGMTPILCVGETLEQREAGDTAGVVLSQVDAVLRDAGAAAFADALIAYEPVWAIGTGRVAEPSQAQEVHELLRRHVRDRDPRAGAALRILYGGSVKPGNAARLFALPDVDGGLIGGASLDAPQFLEIVRAAQGAHTGMAG